MKAVIRCITMENMVRNTLPYEFVDDIIKETKTTYVTKVGLVFRKSDMWQQNSKKQKTILYNYLKLHPPIN